MLNAYFHNNCHWLDLDTPTIHNLQQQNPPHLHFKTVITVQHQQLEGELGFNSTMQNLRYNRTE